MMNNFVIKKRYFSSTIDQKISKSKYSYPNTDKLRIDIPLTLGGISHIKESALGELEQLQLARENLQTAIDNKSSLESSKFASSIDGETFTFIALVKICEIKIEYCRSVLKVLTSNLNRYNYYCDVFEIAKKIVFYEGNSTLEKHPLDATELLTAYWTPYSEHIVTVVKLLNHLYGTTDVESQEYVDEAILTLGSMIAICSTPYYWEKAKKKELDKKIIVS